MDSVEVDADIYSDNTGQRLVTCVCALSSCSAPLPYLARSAGMESPALEMVSVPTSGRVFEQSRTVGLGDADPSGRLRLDALACFLQDVATADYRAVLDEAHGRDRNAGDELGWVLRRLAVEVASGDLPQFGDQVLLRTFAGGLGSRWAERRTQVVGPGDSRVECAGLWVAIDAGGRPTRLTEEFVRTFGPAAGGREVRARLWHEGVPPHAAARPWELRRTDLDTLGHVNNAAHWHAVEELLQDSSPVSAEIEFRDSLAGDVSVALRWVPGSPDALFGRGSVASWLCTGETVHSSARVTFR